MTAGTLPRCCIFREILRENPAVIDVSPACVATLSPYGTLLSQGHGRRSLRISSVPMFNYQVSINTLRSQGAAAIMHGPPHSVQHSGASTSKCECISTFPMTDLAHQRANPRTRPRTCPTYRYMRHLCHKGVHVRTRPRTCLTQRRRPQRRP